MKHGYPSDNLRDRNILTAPQELRVSLYKRVLFPLNQLKYGVGVGFTIAAIFDKLVRSQWVSRDELLDIQAKKLKSLIAHAYRNVPYYREKMDRMSILPGDIQNVSDLEHMPILTKNDIRNNFEQLSAPNASMRGGIEASTSGSTGEPLRFKRDQNTLIWTEAAKFRGTSWARYQWGDRMIDYMSEGPISWLGDARGRLMQQYCFPAFAKEDEIIDHMAKIRELDPWGLIGYSSNLYRIALICRKYALEDIRFRAIFTTAEMLYDFQRRTIEEQFGGGVFDYYGCNEAGSIAYECEYHRKHISDERLIIETTDSYGRQRAAAMGEILITDLDNYAFPLIRYKNGDLGTLSETPCQCGRPLSVLTEVVGRSQDFLRADDGNFVPGVYFPNKFKDLRGVKQYQIIQEDLHHITLNIVKNQGYSDNELQEMKRLIREKVGRDIQIDVHEASDIPLSSGGKMRLVISRLQGPLV